MHAAEGSLVPFDLISDLVVRLLDLCDGSGPAAQRYVGKVGVDHAVLDSNLVSQLEARGARLALCVAHGSLLGAIVRPVAGDVGDEPFPVRFLLDIPRQMQGIDDQAVDLGSSLPAPLT